MTFDPVSAAELDRAEKWMQTDEFRRRVEAARARHHAGKTLNFDRLARDLDLPLAVVLRLFEAHAARSGLEIRAVGRPS